MQFKIMTTDNGPHPADKWAALTAEAIGDFIVIDEGSNSESAIAARRAKPRFVLDVADTLFDHHNGVQDCARADAEHWPHAADDDVECAVDAVLKIASATMFAAHFEKQETKEIITQMMREHFAASIEIERQSRLTN